MAHILLLSSLLIATTLAAVPHYREFELDLDGKIVGGSEAPEGQYPYQILIRYRGTFNCGGSILNNEWILTAAHCVFGFEPYELKVYAGSTRRTTQPTEYDVLETYYHEEYHQKLIKNDVAVIRVPPMTYTDTIQPIILDSEEIGGDVNCTLTGWGRLSFPGQLPGYLQHIELKTTTNEYCKQKLINVNPVLENELCTFTRRRQGSCKGDSGGPLVRKVNNQYQQIGIVSWGKPCARGLPDVYARVSSYIPWIKEHCKQCI